jgi:Holliday junction resolvase RusA-like endonuclease
MSRWEFQIPLEPMPWERVDRGAYGQAYVPDRTRRFKNDLARIVRGIWIGPPLDVPIKLTLKFFIKPQKKPRFHEPATKPDLDNYIKSVKDGLEDVLWTQDSRVTQYGEGTGKYYDKTPNGKPRIELVIETIPRGKT